MDEMGSITFKVVFEPMADENAAYIDEVPELLVGRLERRQVLLAEVGIKVSGFDTRELGDIVHHLFLGRDVVVDKGASLVGARASDTSDSGHRHLSSLDGRHLKGKPEIV